MKLIKLTKGKFAQVDNEDYKQLSKFSWSIRNGKENNLYARRCVKLNGKSKQIYMHREIMKPKHNEYIDHIDRNGLNNQKSNLRVCNIIENGHNRTKSKMYGLNKSMSKFKGVGVYKVGNIIYYQARIQVNKKRIYLGNYKNEVDAAIAYNIAAIKHFKEFANINQLKSK